MITKMKKSVLTSVLAAAAATPGLLFAGAGTAHANGMDGNPTVSYEPYPGGINATVQSWAYTDADCTYNADGWVRRDFHLRGIPKISGTDNDNVGISLARETLNFPGIPAFHPWNVSVECDNGTSTSFVYWY
jgi:hypothetical protein